MDGYQVARAMRADPALAGVTLIALTGRRRDHKAREAGFGGHLAKPPSPEAIMMMLRDARS
jgi:two-component system, sensor histidine kinase